MSRPPRPTSNRNANQIITDLKLDKYKSFFEFYKTKYKADKFIENFSVLDKMRINMIKDKFSRFDNIAKKDFFALAESNPFILASILSHPSTTNEEINKLLYSPVMNKEIALMVAKRMDLDKTNVKLTCQILTEPTIINHYAEKYFNSEYDGRFFCDEIHEMYLNTREDVEKMHYYPLLYCSNEKAIRAFIDKYDLNESEITAISNNVNISPSLRNKVFDLGAEFEEMYNKTVHMKNIITTAAIDTVFNLSINNEEEEAIQESAYGELRSYILNRDLTEEMELTIAGKVIDLINKEADTKDDIELLRLLYAYTENSKVLETYDNIGVYNFELAYTVALNSHSPQKLTDTIASQFIYKLNSKEFTKQAENDVVGTLEAMIQDKELSINKLKDIFKMGYLGTIELMSTSKHTPSEMLQYITNDKDKTSVALYKEIADIHLHLRENNINTDIASAIVCHIQNPEYFNECLYPKETYKKIKETFDIYISSDAILKRDLKEIVEKIYKGSMRYENIKDSGLFNILKDDKSIAHCRYYIEPDITALDTSRITPEEISKRLLLLHKHDLFDRYTNEISNKIIDDFYNDVYSSKSIRGQMIQLYEIIDVYNDIYTNFKQGLDIAKKEIEKESFEENVDKNIEDIQK